MKDNILENEINITEIIKEVEIQKKENIIDKINNYLDINNFEYAKRLAEELIKKEPKYKEKISYGKSIISHAGRLLTTTDLPVSEVMNESGFTNQTIFNRLFKNLYGMTPRQSRISTVNTEYSKESI